MLTEVKPPKLYQPKEGLDWREDMDLDAIQHRNPEIVSQKEKQKRAKRIARLQTIDTIIHKFTARLPRIHHGHR